MQRAAASPPVLAPALAQQDRLQHSALAPLGPWGAAPELLQHQEKQLGSERSLVLRENKGANGKQPLFLFAASLNDFSVPLDCSAFIS